MTVNPAPLQPGGPAMAMTVEDRLWASKAAELEIEALGGIRGLAEKWAASLTGVLGVVGLASLFQGADKFAKLTEPWKSVAQISFTLAVVLALVATALSIAAAQGTAERVFIPGGTALRDYSRTSVDSALCRIKWSRILAALAVVCVLTAGYCLSFGDRAPGSATVIELPAGSSACPAGVTPIDLKNTKADVVVICSK